MWNIIRDESSPDRFHQAIAKVLHKSVHSPMFSEGKIPFGLRAQTRLAADWLATQRIQPIERMADQMAAGTGWEPPAHDDEPPAPAPSRPQRPRSL